MNSGGGSQRPVEREQSVDSSQVETLTISNQWMHLSRIAKMDLFWSSHNFLTIALCCCLAFFLLFPFKPPKFWGRVEQIFQNGPANIWAHKNWKQIFGYFKLRFHNELLHWEKNHFLVFFRAGLHLHVRKISSFSVKQFYFFAKIFYILDNYNKYYFSG